MSLFRPEILSMTGYVPGEQPQGGQFIKLNTNENPYPPSPAVAAAIEEAARRGLEKYPDPLAGAFRRQAAEVLAAEPDWIMAGNGSDDILTIVTRAFVGQGQWLRLPSPSYVLYKTLAQLQGAFSEEVRFRPDWSLPPEFAAARKTCGWSSWPIRTAPRARSFRPARCSTSPSVCPARCWSTRPMSISPTPIAWSLWRGMKRCWSRGA